MSVIQQVGVVLLALIAAEAFPRDKPTRLIPWVILALVVSGCYDPPRHVLGRWERVVASGTWVPAGAVDRMTCWYEGEVLRERGGASLGGTWEEDGLGGVTLRFAGPPEVWQGSNPEWCPDGSTPCLRLRRPDDDDWYRGGPWR